MNNSIKSNVDWLKPLLLYLIGPFSRRLSIHTFNAIMSAFKTGNVLAFKLGSNVDFGFANPKTLLWPCTVPGASTFDYRADYRWLVPGKYHRTCWLCLRSRYNSCHKQEVWSSSWLSKWCQPWPLTAFFVMALMLNALNHSWFLIFLYVGGGIPIDAWLMKVASSRSQCLWTNPPN